MRNVQANQQKKAVWKMKRKRRIAIGINDHLGKDHLYEKARSTIGAPLHLMIVAEASWVCSAQELGRSPDRKESSVGYYQ